MHQQLQTRLTPLLGLKEVEEITNKRKTAIYDAIKLGSFPKPVKTGKRSVAWRAEDLQRWLHSLPESSIKICAKEKL